MYQALYRKWRPRTFEEVVGQEHITTTLKNEMIQGKPAHAYLLMGSPWHRQNHLRQAHRQGGELPQTGGWQPLRPM